jgi:hypothetical protein
MTAHRDRRRQDAQDKDLQTQTKAIKPQEVAKVYKTLGIDSEEARRQYLDWYEAGLTDAKSNFEVIERGDTLTFE